MCGKQCEEKGGMRKQMDRQISYRYTIPRTRSTERRENQSKKRENKRKFKKKRKKFCS